MKNRLKFADLCAGIGGFHIALSNVGMKCSIACEIDKYARQTYIANHNVNNFETDLLKINSKNLPYFDVLCAGFPCQPFSQAGLKLGFLDERSNIFIKILEIIDEKKPKAFFLENVRHILKHDDGRTFQFIKQSLEWLGYSFQYFSIKASDYGLPQNRPRVFIIGFKNGQTISQPNKIPLKFNMSDVLNQKCEKEIGYTIRVGGRGSGIDDRRNWDSYRTNKGIKTINIKEAKMMMGLPYNFKFPVSDTQAMKQLGNSVAINPVQLFAEKIKKGLNDIS